MNTKGSGALAALATVVFLLGLGFLGLQSQRVMQALDRIAAQPLEPSANAVASSRLTEEDIRKIAGQVRLPSAQEWAQAIEKPLASQVRSQIAETQRRAIEEAMQRWSDAARQREEKRWAALVAELRAEREGARNQIQQGEERWREVLAALRQEREVADKRQRQEEERWQKLLAAVRQEREESRKEVREIVRRLDEERAGALERARQLEEERDREIVKRLKQAEKIEQDRKRLIAEFCAKRPDSVMCRDL